MFDREYSFRGKHSEMVIKLTGEFTLTSEDGTNVKKHSLFKRNFDVYLLAPIVGFYIIEKQILIQHLKVDRPKYGRIYR